MLRDEPTLRPQLYRLPTEPLAADVLVPAFRQATSVRGAFGWFTAGWIHNLAPGLAQFLARDDVQPIEFTIAPALFPSERGAVERAVASPKEVVRRVEEEILLASRPDAGALANHAIDCLAWMVATNRLFLSIAIPVPGANYHPKVWLFSDGHDSVAVRGSANATGRAYGAAIEHMDVDCTWVSASRVRASESMVNDWAAGHDPVLERTVPLPVALREHLLRLAPSAPPNEADYRRAARLAEPTVTRPIARRIFTIPPELQWRSGRYSHQAQAVDAWETAGRRGVLAMATGAGKTITALISAYRAWQEHDGPFLLLIAAPTTALVLQWNSECERFGLSPMNPGPGTNAGRDTIGNVLHRLRSPRTGALECLVVTNDALTRKSFLETLRHARDIIPGLTIMLVGDEVHSLGTPSFLNMVPDFIELRLGLSATPVRQYDEDGTGELLSYFGETVYEFGLDRAIGFCLVPYDYFFDVVHLDDTELESFRQLSERISRRVAIAGGFDARDTALRTWLIRRREILENAQAKTAHLAEVINRTPLLRHLLIYTTSKNPEQMEAAAQLLDSRGIAFSRVTQTESSNKKRLAGILAAFAKGDIEVLIAKRVLDEGVDIPEAREAILLSSSTVEREWIQRRGRILRQAPGKTHATIRDVLALPPPSNINYEDSVLAAISRELDRVRAFGRYARNAQDVLAAIQEIHHAYFG
ncbi:DEAD/DEAH box helicase family protein [Streptomyces sp. NPDC047869]|uniref:DEAD/DEAH box helicase family protein n=1 Tax=Streptomyces sp. NPDC047869 TaxID=3154709 RepID=UPI00345224D4